MPRPILLDEIHLAFTASPALLAEHHDRMARTLSRTRFAGQIRRAVLSVIRRHQSLRGVRVTLSR